MLEFDRIFVLDTEFQKPDGEPHRPICLCMIELASQQRWELFFDRPQSCPVEWQPNDLVIGYNLAAEWGTFLARDWTLPPNCIDLYFEHLLQMNGAKKLGLVEDPIVRAESVKLTTALRLCGLQDRINVDKVEERDYIIANGVVPPPGMTLEDHKARVVTYCWSDVYATANLIKPFFNLINIDQALLRGAFSRAVAWMERNGLPLDVGSLRIIQQHHEELLRFVIEETERQYNYGVFKGRVLEQKAFAGLLQRNEWHHHWPLTPAGKYAKDSKTLDAKAKVYPELEPLRALMSTLGKLRTNKIKVGSDGRTRPPVWPLIQASSRCNPTGECILGQSAWLRHLIMPPKGYAVVIVDVVAEEFAIAAALSGDQQMIEIYMSGRDIYLQIAIMGGAVPADATKESHPLIRAKYKTAMLAMNYGVGDVTLAQQLGLKSPLEAELFMAEIKVMFPAYWAYADRRIRKALADGYIETEFGWRLLVDARTKKNTILNYPQQSNGAEILRIASVMAEGRGLGPHFGHPHHDSLYLTTPINQADYVAEAVSNCFGEAGRIVLGDALTLRCEKKIVRYPDRYTDKDSKEMWSKVEKFLEKKRSE